MPRTLAALLILGTVGVTLPVVAQAAVATPAASRAAAASRTAAAASTTAVTSSPMESSVVLELTPRSPEDVSALAAAHNVSRTIRRQLLAAAAPPASSVSSVTTWAQAAGLHVVPISAWSVMLRGPASTLAADFGVSLVPGRNGHPQSSTSLAVPAALAGVVTAADGFSARAPERPHATSASPPYDPVQLADAYDEQLSPSSGSGVTVASVQFQDWDPDDVAVWENKNGITNPPDIERVPVVPDVTPAGGVAEMALDVEAVEASAPAAKQLVYVSNLDDDGTTIYARLAQDAMAGDFQVLTTSWGFCEPDSSTDETTMIENDLAQIVAAGVTVVAASGDAGAYDCDTSGDAGHGLAVDFPASSPLVVALGGTSLTKANPGWSESAWSNPSPSRGYHGDGTGGGQSVVFPAPSWQTGLVTGATGRAVPDISLDADPATGFNAYADGATGYGGTSLSAPLFAGQLASLLAATPCSATCGGFGDIHQALYSAPSADFRDVTTGGGSGTSALAAGPGYDESTGLGSPLIASLATALPPRGAAPTPVPTPPATPSPSVTVSDPCPCGDPVLVAPNLSNRPDVPVSVLGGAGDRFAIVTGSSTGCTSGPFTAAAPASVHLAGDGATVVTLMSLDPDGGCHLSQATITLDTTPPTARARGSLLTPLGTGSVLRLSASEPVTDLVTVQRLDVHPTTVFGPVVTSAGAVSLALPAGTYRLTDTPTDSAGNLGANVTSTWVVPLDAGLRRAGSWSVATRQKGAYNATLFTTAKPGSALSAKGFGRSMTVRYRCQPGGGLLRVVVDGRTKATVDTSCSRVAFRTAMVRGLAAKDHALVLTSLIGRHGQRLTVDDVTFGV